MSPKNINQKESSRPGSSEEHSKLVNEILLYLGSRPNVRIWKNNTGVAKTMDDTGFIRYGLVGSSDIIGIMAPGGRFLAIEVKTGSARLAPAQVNFKAMIEKLGGLYIEARSVGDVSERCN